MQNIESDYCIKIGYLLSTFRWKEQSSIAYLFRSRAPLYNRVVTLFSID